MSMSDDARELVDQLNGMMDSLDESVSPRRIYDQLLVAWNMARDLQTSLSSPPADDVREALAFRLFAHESGQDEEFVRRVWAGHPDEHPVKHVYLGQADALLADPAFEVRPYGTVTDAEMENLRTIRNKVKAYADDRYYHARSRLNTLSSWRVWSDLYQILGLSPKEDKPS